MFRGLDHLGVLSLVDNKQRKIMKKTTATKSAKTVATKTTATNKLTTNPITKKVEGVIEPVVLTGKTETKKATAPAIKKPEMVVLGSSTYHFVRNWLKSIFKEAKIEIKWVKDNDAYTGVIKVHKADVARAKKVYNDFTKSEGCVEMITF